MSPRWLVKIARAARADVPIGIREGVELFDIAKRMAGLPLNPGSQARLEQAMANLERARRQGAPVRDRHRELTAVGDGDEQSDELNGGRLRSHSFGHNLVAQDAFYRCLKN
jgi:hypothetical protein